MMPAATHFDPVVGVDVHMVQPSGPVPPTPIPHPYIGIVFDPFDYLPIIGSTVKINGMHRAIAGTAGKALPSHFPIGGTFVPPLPQNVHENFMGSSTVQMDHDAAAYMALPCLSCQSIGMPPPPRRSPKKKTKIRSLVLPTSIVLPIPKGAPVLIGGSPTVSLFALAAHLVGPLAKAIRRAKAFRKAAAALRKARRRPFRNMKPGFLKCKVLRAEPVDVVTGEVVVDQQDFELPGRIPIRWTRHYRSGSMRKGVCGVGWETPADARLEIVADGVVFHDGKGVATYFDALPGAEPVLEPVDGGRLYRLDRHYAVELKGGLTYYFELPAAPGAEILVAAIVDRCRNSLHFVRDRDGLREVVESAGRRLICASEQGLLRSITLHHPDFPERRTLVRFAYDGDDNLTAVHDALDHPYTFGWDDRHRLVRHTNRTGLSFYYEYDAESRCVHSWGDGGLYDYRFDYDPIGRFTNLTDSLGHPWTVEYDDQLQITRETDPLGGVTSYAYDEVGRTTAVVGPIGHTTAYEYDERGNLVKLTRADGTTIMCEYDRNDRPVRTTDPNGEVWEQRWDEQGLLAEQKSPLGAIAAYAHDAGGQLVSFTNPRGAVTRVACDAFGGLVLLTDALGHVTRFQRDILGNVTTRTDPLGHTTAYHYDAKGQHIKTALTGGAAIECSYDPSGRLLRYMDENGAVTQLTYFGQGRVKTRVQPDGHSIVYQYDTEERLIAVTNERGETYRLERDAFGNIIKENDYWGQTWLYCYDPAGHVRQRVDPLGRMTCYATDPLGRVLRKILQHPERPSETFEERFEFDANGNLVRATNPYVTVTRSFDAEGRLLVEDQGGFQFTNSYDEKGNRIRRETSAGNVVAYAYDALDRVISIGINGAQLIAVERDARGQIIQEALGGDLVRQYRYDAIGRQTAQALARNRESLFAVHFDYDLVGNIIRRSDSQYGTDLYRYDPLGRILAHVAPRGELSRLPTDPAGDLLTTGVRPRGAGGGGYEANSEGDEWAREGSYDGRCYRFDRAGNLVSISGSGSGVGPITTSCRWDTNQRLVQSTTGQNVTRYVYDPLGRRLFKETNGRRVSFYWDGDALAAEETKTIYAPAANRNHDREANASRSSTSIAPSGGPSVVERNAARLEAPIEFPRAREYLYYPRTFEPLALIERSQEQVRVHHFHREPNGCPTRLTDGTGQVLWAVSYDARGGVAKLHADTVAHPIRLQGQYEDSETGLHYNRHRYYGHAIGQFVGQDPLRLRPSHRIYSLGPNTLGWADPLGLAGHNVTFSLHRPSTGWTAGGEEASGMGLPRGEAPKMSFQDQLQTHTERWVMLRAEPFVEPGDELTIRGTKPPCGHRNMTAGMCASAMEEFADIHDVRITYIDETTGRQWVFAKAPLNDCGS
jgi:RHS repeat-associated protein